MKIFYTKDFHGHWPVGSSAIVVAEDRRQARKLLDEQLKEIGLYENNEGEKVNFEELTTEKACAIIINDGDY